MSMKRLFVVGPLLLSTVMFPAMSQQPSERVPTEELVEGIKSSDGRWFEVEMIVFKRDAVTNLREIFDRQVPVLQKNKQWDLVRQQLQPNITDLLDELPLCYQHLNPLTLPVEQAEQLSAAEFFQQMQDYQALLTEQWRFTNELCLMPSEQRDGYWQLFAEPEFKGELNTHVPLESIPSKVTGGDFDDFHDVYLLAPQNLQLTEHFNKLVKQSGITPMLHVGWRQPGLTKRRAMPVYLVAGQNYSNQYRYDGSAKPAVSDVNLQTTEMMPEIRTEQQLVNQFMKKLADGARVDFKSNRLLPATPDKVLPEQTWQLDGFIEVHLQHYLFIDAQFNLREPIKHTVLSNDIAQFNLGMATDTQIESESSPEMALSAPLSIEIEQLQTYQMKQTRRLYSGDLHYLDHPKFGVLIQIRKYRH